MISWKLHEPGAASAVQLEEISELRGRVLYANGRRPRFRLATGRFADPDPLDPEAYHIVALESGNPVGCVRNVPVSEGIPCITDHLLGQTHVSEMLAGFGVEKKDAVECSRWMLDPEFRASHIGALLAGGAVAVARTLGFKLLFCSVGTRDKQDRMLARLGLRYVPGLPLIAVPEYNDDLCVMYIKPHLPTPRMAELMAKMDLELKLKQRKSGRLTPGRSEAQRVCLPS
jgi:hypothetical protein